MLRPYILIFELWDVSDLNMQGKIMHKDDRMMASSEQGSTITTDLTISGLVVFTDASWKCRKISGFAGAEATGIGVFIRDETLGNKCSIMIQAATDLTSSVFQAEAKAFQLAATLVQFLNIDRVTFLTDNQLLAKVAASRRLDHPLMHWDTRDAMACFFAATSRSSTQVFHIKRDLNRVAHDCAHQALRRSLKQPIYSCVCSTHSSGHCPVISVLQSVNLQGFVIHAVLCN